MKKPTTIAQHVEAILDLEARRLSYERAAELLYNTCCQTDLGPPEQTIKAELWFASTIPDAKVFAVVLELQEKAREIGVERARLERARISVAGTDAAIAADDEDRPVLTRIAG